MAHVPARRRCRAGHRRARDGGARSTATSRCAAETAELNYAELRKRERPFVMPLDAADPEPVERAAYDAAYKGVTDVADALSVAPPGLLPDPLGGAGGPLAQCRHRDRRDPVRARLRSCSGAANIGGACCRASSSWCSTRSTGSSRGAPAPRRNGAMCSTTASTSSTRRSGGGRGRMASPPTAGRSSRSTRRWCCGRSSAAMSRSGSIEGAVHQALRRHAHPRLEADRQPVPADHRAAQPEHGDPGRRAAVPPARYRSGSWSRGGRSSA